ncbi:MULTISPECIES: DMT family transporter [unclassified Microcoleus]|uniref:DMT family transporter n=1 Tax=unclassified Microcoleus TaxID=2642155 RepID=UPI002FD19811
MNESNKTTVAIASLFVGIVAISFGSIFIRWNEAELSPNATIFNRFWLGSVVFGLWQGYKAIRQRLSGDKPVQQHSYTSQEMKLLLGAGTFFAATLAFVARSLTKTSVAISTILHNLTPIFTSKGAQLLFGQGFNRQFLIGTIAAIGGAIAIEIEQIQQIAAGEVTGGIAAIVSAVFMGAYLLAVEQMRTKFDPIAIQLWVCAIATLSISPMLVFAEGRIFPSSVNGWLFVIFLALACQVLGQGLLTYSVASLSSVVVSLVHLLEPVFSSILAWAIFWEKLSFSNWVGFARVLIGLYIAVSSQAAVHLPQNRLESG